MTVPNLGPFWAVVLIVLGAGVLILDVVMSWQYGRDQTLSRHICLWARHWPIIKMLYVAGAAFLFWHLFFGCEGAK
jgi:hypothetical protein